MQERKKISTREKKERPSVFFKVAYFFLLIIFLGLTVYVLVFSRFLKINHLNLGGTKELKYEEVYGRAQSLLEGKYLDILPKNNFLLVSKKRIRGSLLGEFKKIRDAEVQKVFPGTVNIKIAERDALILWCAQGPCYIIDEEGYAYAGADFESDEIKENNLVKITDISAQSVEIGKKVLDKKYVSFIFQVREAFKRDVSLEILDEYATKYRISGEIEVKTHEDWSIYLNSSLPLDKSVRTLKTFLESEINEESRKNLEYADLRIENKVYYKLKNSEAGAENVSGEKAGEDESADETQKPAENNGAEKEEKESKKKKNKEG